jgi:DNA polymerase elongation subunit (family B)
MEYILRIFDFNVYNAKGDSESSDEEQNTYKDTNNFVIQLFGVDEKGKTYSVTAEGYKPFFYIMVNDTWTIKMKEEFLVHLKEKMGNFYSESVTDCKIIKRKKLYGFDGGKEHKFIFIEFANLGSFNKAKNLWYSNYEKGHTLLKDGYKFRDTYLKLYEANIPPLLRFFHIKDISPSGWIAIPKKKSIENKNDTKTVNCDYEFATNYKNIIPLNDNELRVPYKIMSFDIEASSSHGDFPVPIKTYKKLATNIVEYFENLKMDMTKELCKNILRRIILSAFGYDNMEQIDIVYPKRLPGSKEKVQDLCEVWLGTLVRNLESTENSDENTIESMFEKMGLDEEEDEHNNKDHIKSYADKKATIVDILCDKKFEREGKLIELNESLRKVFPKLEGDKVTFIGSTFMNYGNKDPHFNHCIVLNTCSDMEIENSCVETYNTEKEVLLAWQKLVQKENPDIIIGYNIFGFDYEFMFRRAEENNCVEEFLKLSRNKDEICGTKDNGKWKIEESTIQIASGQHDLRFIKMNGRLQVDLYNFYRREANLISYKLDYVAGNFIGDFVKELQYTDTNDNEQTIIKTSNMTGLLIGSYVHFEEIGHSVDYYDDGAKYCVINVDKANNKFTINGIVKPDFEKKIRWCLAKDDVTPKDIFRMTNGTADDRAVIAKYCIQDCNLVHYLFNKSDILTGFIEMAKICSVPINFLVMRGQGIKLTSYIAKKCREKRTLMPVIEKGGLDEGYEGAIVLDPKCDLYLDNPVACVDYASLYPSSMISENLSHDSKVWTREYDLAGNLIEEWGEKNEAGNYIYDNLPGYEYVDVNYDTYRYHRKHPKAAAEKIKSGYKMCRFVQPVKNESGDGEAIMPSILKELLKARKDTRKLIPLQTDEFMKNVLDQRQLGYKVTANSLYGQCGAKTSTFYEKDIAACTTATGRKLLTYAKKIIEECYGNKICETEKYGPVLTKAEYIYGDSVANYTPVYISTFKKGKAKEAQNRIMDILTIEQLAEKYGNNNWIKCVEPGKQDKEFCELEDVDTWTEKGWTKLFRVIRHQLASHKKMLRVLTHTGCVDVTDDHSLVRADGTEISPKDCNIGLELLHKDLPFCYIYNSSITEEEAQIMGFFFGDGSCGSYDCASGKKSSWALNNASLILLNEYQDLCRNVYPELDWEIMDTIDSSGVYKLTPRSNMQYGKISSFVNKYRQLMYSEKMKIIPLEILYSDENIQKAFWKGMYDADGDKDIHGYIRIDQKNQLSATLIYLLAKNLGYSVSINTRSDKQDIYRISLTNKKQRKNPIAIKKLNEIQYEGFVYDLTTENHHFAAGVGNMIVHNTDSVFFTFNLQTPDGKPIRGKDALEITIEIAQEAGHLASKFLKGPHDLEYEKTFMPFCLLSKKRYVGMLYETDPNKGKRKEMGIVLKRRDNAPIVKDIYGGIIDILMKKQNIQEAIDFLKSCLQNIVEEKYPMEKLIITKSLRSGYKNPQSIAHKVLADRITARDPGSKPSSGDRIPFVYIVTNNKKALQGEKIETPTFIKENGLKIDYSFYITNQIMKPVQQVFALVLEKIWTMQKKIPKIRNHQKEVDALKKEYYDDIEKFEDKKETLRCKEIKVLLFDEYLRETNNEKNGVQSLTKFFEKK